MMLCWLHWKDEDHKMWLFVATGVLQILIIARGID